MIREQLVTQNRRIEGVVAEGVLEFSDGAVHLELLERGIGQLAFLERSGIGHVENAFATGEAHADDRSSGERTRGALRGRSRPSDGAAHQKLTANEAE